MTPVCTRTLTLLNPRQSLTQSKQPETSQVSDLFGNLWDSFTERPASKVPSAASQAAPPTLSPRTVIGEVRPLPETKQAIAAEADIVLSDIPKDEPTPASLSARDQPIERTCYGVPTSNVVRSSVMFRSPQARRGNSKTSAPPFRLQRAQGMYVGMKKYSTSDNAIAQSRAAYPSQDLKFSNSNFVFAVKGDVMQGVGSVTSAYRYGVAGVVTGWRCSPCRNICWSP